jgi:TM2 domain-containing membrane protein YozV
LLKILRVGTKKPFNQFIMMKCLKTLTVLSVLAVSFVLLTSAVPAGDNSEKPNKMQQASLALDKAAADGKVSYQEIKSIAEDLKGSKLSLKEKVALKLFGKKISQKATSPMGGKSQVVALILVLCVGAIGIHRFYLGYTWQGIVQFLTLGICGIWTLIDLIRILTGDLKPKDGEYETTL